MGLKSLQFTLPTADVEYLDMIFLFLFPFFMEGLELLTLDSRYCLSAFPPYFCFQFVESSIFLLNNVFVALRAVDEY